jgi:hypothetical protein
MKVEREIGRMLGKNSRAAKLFDVKVTKTTRMPLASNGQSRSHPRLGNAERRLLPASDERRRLVRRRTLESLHSVNRSRIRISNPQERPVDSPDLAHKRRPCPGSHLRVLSWRTCCGKHWGNCVTKRGWAANLAECFPNCPTSARWTSCCRLAPARRSAPAAFQNPLTTNKSCWKNSASNCPRK